jgi:hypothetical protein
VPPPAVTVCDAGVAEIEKSGFGGPVTVKVTLALWLKLPLVPVTVRVKLPVAVVLEVDTFSVEDPDVLIDDGLRLAVAPLGNPPAFSDTVPLNPFSAPMETV